MEKIKKFFHQSNSIKGATGILVVTLFLSNILGMLRDHFLAQKIPTSLLDTYYAAFRIPDLVFNIFILGAISAAFIPVFTNYRKKNQEEAWHVANSFLNIIVLFLALSIVILFFIMPNLIDLFYQSFSEEKRQLTTQIARWLLLSPLLFSLSYLMSGILNSFKRFFVYSLSPLIYNFSIIIATLVFADKMGVKGVVLGVVIGAFLHFIIQLPIAIKLGFRYKFVFDRNHPGVKEIITLMIPRSIGLGSMQAMLLIYSILAAGIGAGSIAIFNLADNIQTMPTVVFATSIATAIFPALSESSAKKDKRDFINYFIKGVRAIIYTIVPISIGVILLRAQIVRLILGSGQFNWNDTVNTANVLGIFSVSLLAQGLIPLFSRTFYALHDTKNPTIISIISIFIGVILAYFLSRSYGILGLASAYSISSIINFVLLYLFLRRKIDIRNSEKQLFVFIGKVVLATLCLIIAVQISKWLVAMLVDMHRFWGIFLQTFIATLFGGSIYLFITSHMKLDEIQEVKYIIKKKLGLVNETEIS